VQARTVILIALLAIVRKMIILDLGSTEALQLLALAAAILALGAVYWLVRSQDRSIDRDDIGRLGGSLREQPPRHETRRGERTTRPRTSRSSTNLEP
jgi:uncharacterized membrane protein (DUF373 family)